MDVTAKLQGYSFTEKLYDGSRTLVYRGIREGNADCAPHGESKPVVVKFLKNELPSFNELVKFSHQYSIAKDIDLPTIVRPLALVPCGNASALVMEDFGGCNLNVFLRQYCTDPGSSSSSNASAVESEQFGTKPEAKPNQWVKSGLAKSQPVTLEPVTLEPVTLEPVKLEPVKLGNRIEHLILFCRLPSKLLKP